VDVIGLDSQRQKEPALFLALVLNEVLTAFFDLANKDRLAPTRTPDEMIHNQVHSMLIALIFKVVLCLIHLSTIYWISTEYKGESQRETRLTAWVETRAACA
jgi:hypothetical protein